MLIFQSVACNPDRRAAFWLSYRGRHLPISRVVIATKYDNKGARDVQHLSAMLQCTIPSITITTMFVSSNSQTVYIAYREPTKIMVLVVSGKMQF